MKRRIKMCGSRPWLVLLFACAGLEAVASDSLEAYNVVWDSPSADCHGSMPIGNGDLAANVWVEPNGDLVFYLSKSDAWSGDQDLLKLGRVRVRLDEPLMQEGSVFKQELDLATGTIRIQSEIGNMKSAIRFWIDANNPVVNVEIEGSEAFNAQVSLESWRTPEVKRYGGAEPDTILCAEGDTIRWYQRNIRSVYADNLNQQHLGHLIEKYPDPLKDLTFGGLISGEGLETKDAQIMVTKKPVKSLHVRVHALTAQTETSDEWIKQIEAQRDTVEALPVANTRKQHETYWTEFWSRSRLLLSGTPDAERVAQAYVLQRWVQSCAGRGAYPIKFNGSLFTVDGLEVDRKTKVVTEHGPDYRRWGGCYWFQNTREPYWAMLYSGDFDQMEALWEMYRDALPLLKDRTHSYFKHDGIFCSETMQFWGLNKSGDFGRNNPSFYPTNPWIRYYWDSGNELSLMMLDFYAHSQEEAFAKTTLIPIAGEVVKFYDQHYQRNAEGKVHFSPSMALETWHEAEDPLPLVVGLQTVLTRLLDLPEKLTTPEQRADWKRFLSELPEIPVGEEGATKWIKPAHVYSEKKNSENPELYAVFPYRTYTVGKPDLELARETWRRRLVKRTGGWSQDAIQAAMLGLTHEAKGYVVKNVTNRSPIGSPPVVSPRFPAFWGPNFDGTPDQCHGSVTMIALQRMLMLCDGDTIRLLPAWPKEWNADFKLHAPQNTTVEGRVVDGKLVELQVTPESRRKDVIIMDAQSLNN